MTSFRTLSGLALALIGWLATPASAQSAPPASLATRIQQLGAGFNGRVGIAVQSVEGRWRVGYKDSELYPQQSVSKFWVAMTALDAVDRGQVRLSDPVTITRGDLTLFHQPIAARVLKAGSVTSTLGALMFEAITKSDNTANDRLMRVVGGPPAVRAMIARKGLGQIRFYEGERALQSRIAGVTWSPAYSVGNGFNRARAMVPLGIRTSLFNRYVDQPYDGAAPASVVDALARLKRGELLSPTSSAHLLTTMSNTRTGKNRLRGGMRPGWTLSHKTGTGQVLGGVQAGYNDIGVITAPNGQSYAVAVMIKRTGAPIGTRMTLMNNVVRAVIDAHEAIHGDITL
jgi:beta-lactamase class A